MVLEVYTDQTPIDLVEKLFSRDGRYEKMFIEVTPHILQGRPYNYIHTLWGLGDIFRIALGEGREDLMPTLVAAFAHHDTGWATVANVQTDPAIWSSIEGRVLHMEAGAQLAGQTLPAFDYPEEQIKHIQDLIAHHDDIYLVGELSTSSVLQNHKVKEPHTPSERIHRDADAAFIFSIYFWKDWWTRGKDAGISPLDFLLGQIEKYGKASTPSGQKLLESQIAMRMLEIEKGDDFSETHFRLTELISIVTSHMGPQLSPLIALDAAGDILRFAKTFKKRLV